MGRLYEREKLFEQKTAAEAPGKAGDFSAGFTTGYTSLKQLGAGAIAATGDAIGNEDMRQFGVDKYKKYEQDMAPYQENRPTSVENIDSVGSAIDWAQYQLGNLTPSMLESVGSALIGAVAGGVASTAAGPEATIPGAATGFIAGLTQKALVKGYLEKQVAKMVAKGVAEDVAQAQATKYVAKKAGAAVVMFGNSYVQGVGDVYGETMDSNGKGNAMAAFLGAVPYAAIDTVVDMSVIGRTLEGTVGESVLKRYAAAVVADATSEGAQESAQEAILMASGVASGKSYDTQTVISRLGNSFAAAALGGGVAGVTGGHKAPDTSKVQTTTQQNTDVPFTDAKPEETFTKVVQSLPEKDHAILSEAVSKPMEADRISVLTPEERQVMGIALNAAKEIPGANIANIESNIAAIEQTGVKIPLTQQQEVKVKEKVAGVPALETKTAVEEKPKVTELVKEKTPVVEPVRADVSPEQTVSAVDKVMATQPEAVAKIKPAKEETMTAGQFKEQAAQTNFGRHLLASWNTNTKGEHIAFTQAYDLFRKYKAMPKEEQAKLDEKFVPGYKVSGEKLGAKKEVANPSPKKTVKNEKQLEAKKTKTLKYPAHDKMKDTIAARKEAERKQPGNTQTVTDKIIANKKITAADLSKAGVAFPKQKIAKLLAYSPEFKANPILTMQDGMLRFKGETSSFSINPDRMGLDSTMIKEGDQIKIAKEELTAKEGGVIPILDKISDEDIQKIFKRDYVEKKIREIAKTVNPDLRKRLVFAITKEIIDRHGNVSWGQYDRREGKISVSQTQGSKTTLHNTIVHEIMHNAWDFFDRKERGTVIKYINSLSLQEKREILGKGIDDTWRYDSYVEKYGSNNMMLAEEIIVTQSADKQTTNPVITSFRDTVASIIKLIHRITGLLDKQYKGIKARELFYGVFEHDNPMFSDAWRNATGEVLANIAKKSEVFKGKLSDKSIENFSRPISDMEVSREITPKGNLRTQEVFKSAWRKLYGEEAPGSLADLLIRPADAEVIIKGNKISFESGKKVANFQAAIKSREEKQALREKNSANVKEIRASLTKMFKEKIATGQVIKAKVIEYVKENIPKAKQEKFLVSVKNAKTPTNLKRVMAYVDEVRSKYERAMLVDSIKSIANNIQNLPVDIQRTIIGITSEIELKKHTKKLLQRLNSTKEYLDKQENDHEMPRRVLNELGILDRTPFEQLSTQQLMDINNKLQQYKNVGQNIMKDKAVLQRKTLEQSLTDLQNGSTNLDKTKPGDKLNTFVKDNLENPDDITSFKDKAKEFFSMDKDRFVRLRLSLMGSDRLFNLIDGKKDYEGINYKTFKEPVDEKHNLWQYSEDKIKRSFYNTINELKLTEKSSKRIAIYAYTQQRGGVKKLIEDHGYTKEQLDAIKLNEKEMAMYKFMRQHLDDLHVALTEKMAKENNVQLGKQENYFPMMTNYGVTKPLLEELEQMGRMKSAAFGSMKERKENAHQLLKLDAFQVFDSYVGKSTYFIAMDSTLQNLNKIASSDKYRTAVGDNAQRSVLTWLDVLARKGGAVKKEAKWEEKINEYNNKLSVVVLGMRLTTIIKQPLALLDGAAEIGAYAFSGTRMIINEEWRTFIDENSSEMRNRAGGDPAFMELSHNKFLPTIQDKAMLPIKFLDQYTAGAVWAGAYTKKMDELGLSVDLKEPNKLAMKYADLVVRKTQASGSFKDLPLAMVNEYRTASKLMFKFQTFVLNRWGYLSEDLPDKMKNNKKLAVQQVAFLSLSMLMETGVNSAYQSIMGTGNGGDDKDNMFVRAIKNILSSSIQTVPFLGQLISSTSFGSNPLPLVEFGNKFFDSLKQITVATNMSTREKHALRAMSYSLGIYFGIPTEQARQLIEGWLFPSKKNSKNSKL